MERRAGGRCPVCQGPAVEDATKPDGMRCRRSTCKHNHSHAQCPRCKSLNLENVTFKDGDFFYTCEDCTNRWSVPEASG